MSKYTDEVLKKISMDPALKEEWCTALTDGSHTQTKGQLKNTQCREEIPIGMCCLGVLADVCINNRTINAVWDRDMLKYDTGYGNKYEEAVLPLSIYVKLGLPSSDGNLPFEDRNGNVITLADANDAGFTFSQIADLIRHFY